MSQVSKPKQQDLSTWVIAIITALCVAIALLSLPGCSQPKADKPQDIEIPLDPTQIVYARVKSINKDGSIRYSTVGTATAAKVK